MFAFQYLALTSPIESFRTYAPFHFITFTSSCVTLVSGHMTVGESLELPSSIYHINRIAIFHLPHQMLKTV